MFRQYEDIATLKERLKEAEAYLAMLRNDVSCDDIDAIVDAYEEVESLRERINFAIQDAEYDEVYC